MFNQTFVYTAVFSALFMVLSLMFMELFSFIKWSPIGWAERSAYFEPLHFTIKWGMLFLGLMAIFAVIYILTSFLDSIPPGVSALFIGIIGLIALEWFISEPKSPVEVITSISIPLLATTAIVLRFIAGTAVYHKELLRKV